MGYEVYLPTNSIRLDSKATRGEYVAIPCQKGGEEYNERGSDSLIKGGENYLRGRFQQVVYILHFKLLFSFLCL